MARIGLLVLLTQPQCKIERFLFTNQLLMEKDEEDFSDLWKLLPNSSKVNYKVGLNMAAKPEDVLVVDKGNHLLFTDPKKFRKMTDRYKVISLSATSDRGDEEDAEAAVLNKLGYRMFKNQIFKDDRND